MKISKLLIVLLTVLSPLFSSCDKEIPDPAPSTSTVEVTKPSFYRNLSTSDLASFSIRMIFKSGADEESNIRAVVHWKAYKTKPTTTPSKGELSTVESMSQYGSAIYRPSGSKKVTEMITFDKSHAGYSGSYIYYYVECMNSAGSTSTSVTYLKAK